MPFIVAVCGAGGKTGYIRKRAREAARSGKKTAVSTTTHIGCPAVFSLKESYGDADSLTVSVRYRCENYDVIGKVNGEESGKLCMPDAAAWERMCREYDFILVEADGSRHYPIKIPALYEPVIPENADEIVVIMGLHAVGRHFGTVCHRAELLSENSLTEAHSDLISGGLITEDAIVTKELICSLADKYYLKPLSEQYPQKKISLFLSDMETEHLADVTNKRRPALVLLASGFGRRFGGNKLLHPFHGRPLYQNAVSRLQDAQKKLTDHSIQSELIVCTSYQEIEEQLSGSGMTVVHNKEALEGISASIRLGVRKASELGCTDYAFFAADMPYLPSADIARFLLQYLCSEKSCGLMCAGKKLSNPGILSVSHAKELLGLTGESGGMRVIRNYPLDTYFYQIEEEKLKDIDVPEDIDKK
ncbi:MAG: selenium cofactor biosynthesis protein YqeC [Eubacteriales bacterium]|nr:selenium cofactor biosynthesis protein YqeC [Eubacteriales bacterium]